MTAKTVVRLSARVVASLTAALVIAVALTNPDVASPQLPSASATETAVYVAQ